MKFVDPFKKDKEEQKKAVKIEKLASNREELLKKIREKEKKKQNKPKVETEEAINEEKDVEEKNKIVISKKSEERKKQQEDVKKRTSSRDILKQKIQDLEKQISGTKYNKRTQGAIGVMKAQLAALKAKLASGSGKGGASKDGYSVKKSGDATVVLLGFPSAGKSTLLNKITRAESETGAYAFTTLTVIPGMLEYNQAKIQILDVPGIVEGAAAGTGRGKEVLQVIRTADLILMLIDATNTKQKKLIEKEVYDSHVRVNTKKPDVKIKRMLKDGIRVGRTVQTEIDDQTVESILKQFRIINAEVIIRDDINADQLIDVIEGNKVYIPSLVILNKVDLLSDDELKKIKKEISPDLCISGQKGQGIEELKELIYKKLNFIRIYLKEINKKADMDEPMIMRRGATIKDLCEKLHKDFIDKFKYARLWGPSAKFDGQMLQKLGHKLKDKDVVEIHLK